jgi:NADH/NAD ratio-sensing transcriptional regulator Rex
MTILLYISVILLNAVGDGLNDRGTKGVGHAFEPLFIALLIIFPSDLVWYVKIIGYTFLNIALFDYAYNIARGLKISFVGTTSWWDIAIKRDRLGLCCL